MAVNSVTTSNVRWYNGDPTADGVGLGSTATSKVGFHGKTPIIQATVAATTTTTTTTGALTVDVDAIRTALINKGIIV